MAQMNFGGVEENVVTREEFPLEKAREVLKNETIAVINIVFLIFKPLKININETKITLNANNVMFMAHHTETENIDCRLFHNFS